MVEASRMAEQKTADALEDMVPSLLQLANNDAYLIHRGRFVDLDILVEIGATSYQVHIDHGRIANCDRNPLPLRPWTFAIRGSADTWRRFWQPIPEPQFHDIFALVKRGGFRIEGNTYPLMQNLLYFKDVLAAPRQHFAGR